MAAPHDQSLISPRETMTSALNEWGLPDDDFVEPIQQETLDRFVLFPIKNQDFYNIYTKMVDHFWRQDDVLYEKDLPDWERMTPELRHFIELILAFFGSSDTIVNENLAVNFYREMPWAEVRLAIGFQIAIEGIHSEVYGKFLETLVKDSDRLHTLLHAVETIPSVKRKAGWALHWIGSTQDDVQEVQAAQDALAFLKNLPQNDHVSDLITRLGYRRPPLAVRLVAMICVEGIFFAGAFAAIDWLKFQGLMPALTFSNVYISRDEKWHCTISAMAYKHLQRKLPQAVVHKIFSEAVDIESEFLADALPVGLKGMNADLMKQHIQFIADFWLSRLGYEKIYGSQNPFGFISLMRLENIVNGFEDRNPNYSFGNKADPEKNVVRFDSDF